LSPYLFLIVADTLQALIRSAATVHHPVDSERPCAVLQYADDTMIVIRGEIADVHVTEPTNYTKLSKKITHQS
jgi:hypothetical protein